MILDPEEYSDELNSGSIRFKKKPKYEDKPIDIESSYLIPQSPFKITLKSKNNSAINIESKYNCILHSGQQIPTPYKNHIYLSISNHYFDLTKAKSEQNLNTNGFPTILESRTLNDFYSFISSYNNTICSSIFFNGRPNESSFVFTNLLIIDIDDCIFDKQSIERMFKCILPDNEYIISTTKSHDDNGLGCYKVFIPVDSPIYQSKQSSMILGKIQIKINEYLKQNLIENEVKIDVVGSRAAQYQFLSGLKPYSINNGEKVNISDLLDLGEFRQYSGNEWGKIIGNIVSMTNANIYKYTPGVSKESNRTLLRACVVASLKGRKINLLGDVEGVDYSTTTKIMDLSSIQKDLELRGGLYEFEAIKIISPVPSLIKVYNGVNEFPNRYRSVNVCECNGIKFAIARMLFSNFKPINKGHYSQRYDDLCINPSNVSFGVIDSNWEFDQEATDDGMSGKYDRNPDYKLECAPDGLKIFKKSNVIKLDLPEFIDYEYNRRDVKVNKTLRDKILEEYKSTEMSKIKINIGESHLWIAGEKQFNMYCESKGLKFDLNEIEKMILLMNLATPPQNKEIVVSTDMLAELSGNSGRYIREVRKKFTEIGIFEITDNSYIIGLCPKKLKIAFPELAELYKILHSSRVSVESYLDENFTLLPKNTYKRSFHWINLLMKCGYADDEILNSMMNHLKSDTHSVEYYEMIFLSRIKFCRRKGNYGDEYKVAA